MADETPEVWRKLYGTPDGRWLILRGVVGTVSPPSLTVGVGSETVSLPNLGDPADVVRAVYQRLVAAFGNGHAGRAAGGRAAGAAVQQVIGEMLGVSQSAVSRYVIGRSTPALQPAGWSNLVRVYYAELDRRSE